MLEASGFDFRNRYPQRLLLKITRIHGLDKDTVGKTAYNMSLDLYRTFAPLKQTTSTMAIACVELAGRILEQPIPELEAGEDYGKWKTTHQEIMGLFHGFSTILAAPKMTPLTISYRDPPGSVRLVHPPPSFDDSRPRPFSGEIHQYTHRSQPRSLRPTPGPLHPKRTEQSSNQRHHLERRKRKERSKGPDKSSRRSLPQRHQITSTDRLDLGNRYARARQTRLERRHRPLHA